MFQLFKNPQFILLQWLTLQTNLPIYSGFKWNEARGADALRVRMVLKIIPKLVTCN